MMVTVASKTVQTTRGAVVPTSKPSVISLAGAIEAGQLMRLTSYIITIVERVAILNDA